MNELIDSTAYDEAYFNGHAHVTLQSAEVVVPLVQQLLQPASVIDVGCGRGAWLRLFQERGVQTIHGVDGPYVTEAQLLIDKANYTAKDLSKPFELEGRYDLALCLEVAEHLPPEMGPVLVRNLVALAPLVLFSAAIPGQGGVCHVNEQWPAYWRELFAQHGYRCLDPIRRVIVQDRRIAWWYRQNIVLFASPDALAQSPALQAEEKAAAGVEFEMIHVNVLHRYNDLNRYRTLLGILREVPRVAWQAITKRFRGSR